MKKYFYCDGKILDSRKPAILINDLAVLRGYGVFDFMRTYHGRLFHFTDHFARFGRSAKILGLKVPLSADKVKGVITELIKKNKCQDASVRLLLTGGPAADGLTPSKATFAILIEDIYDFPAKLFEEGGKLVILEHQRHFPAAKNNNYIQAVISQKWKKKKGAVEILYMSQGKILEPSTSNFFIFKGDTLITPGRGILEGVTRKIVLSLAKKRFTIEIRDVKVSELSSATEAFITATNKKVLPIVVIDGKKVGRGKVGENTRFLQAQFEQYVKNY